MQNYCAFSKDHTCIKWMDYEITREQLEEAETLANPVSASVLSSF